MSTPAKKGGILATISSSFSHFGSAAYSKVNSLLGHEHLEVVPEGGQGDVEDEAAKGRFKLEERESMWKMMHKYIGADITSMVTLPVMIFEPMTMLQKMAELMEYNHLLDMADQCEDPHMKLVYASTWALSVYYAYQRTWKPFNPILGETYEMVNDNGFMFIAEQVSHHPPMSSAHAENEHFSYDVTSRVKTKFLGNSLDVFPVGRTRVLLKRSNMVLDLVPPPTKVHNLIVGRTWVDSPGDMIMTNLTTGDKAVLYFQPCGWFGRRFGRARKGGRHKARQPGQKVRYEVDGYVYNKNEEPKFIVSGNWNKSMSYQPCDAEGEPTPGTDLEEIWNVAEVPKGDKFQYTYFAHQVNSFESAPAGLLPSDSRLRPDRYALEMGDMNKAGSEKSRLEERQRTEKRFRDGKKQEYSPRWFRSSGHVAPTLWGDLEIYEYNGKYTKHRQHQDSISSKPVDLDQLKSIPFNPWQYGQPEDQNIPHGSQVLPLASEPILS